MATLAVAGVGAAIGWGVGGTAVAMSIGWSVGSALGSYLFAPDGPDIEGPRLNDLDVQSAAYGRPKPETWGTMRQAGQVIAADRIKETKHVESTGGKGGGGGGTQTTYTYSITFAIAFGEGPIDGIRRIWANGDLIWTADPEASAAQVTAAAPGISVYYGTEDQEPDPTLEAIYGAGNVPAYRGTPYLVFQDLELEDYGNAVPHIEAEVVRAGAIAPVTEMWKRTGGQAEFSNYPGGIFYEQGLIKVLHSRWTYREMCQRAPKRLHVYDGNGQWIGEEMWTPPPSLAFQVMSVIGPDVTDCGEMAQQSRGPIYLRGRLGNQWVWADDLTNQLHIGTLAIPESEANPARSAVSSDGRYVAYRNPDNSSRITILDDQQHVVLDDHDLGFTLSYFAIESGYLWNYRGDSFAVDLYTLDFATGAAELIASTPHEGGTISATRNTPLVVNNTLYIAGQTGSYSLAAITRLPLIDATETTLDAVVSDLCVWAGLSGTDFDVAPLQSTVVPGYSRTKSMTARRAIEPLQQVYRFDAVESDWMLRFVPRGQEPVVDIPYEDLAAHPYGQDRPEAIGETRTQEPELPREVVMRYLDVDADYEDNAQRSQRIITGSEHKESIDVPIAESADHMAQSAEILLYTAWLERTKHRVLLPPAYEYLDPSDVITTTEADGTTHQLRIARVRNGNILELEGITDSPSVYTSDATGSGIDLDPSVIGQRGPTRAALLDIPILRDQDNDPGFYVAANGWLEGWTGSVLYVSSDGGESYGSVLPVLTGSPMGAVTNTLPDGPVSVIDRASTINVQLPLGELESVTDEALMDGRRNACAVGTPAGWEILQFRDAVLEADGTYTLSHLIRGRRGTEWMTGQHASGERFVLLSPAALERAPASVDNIGSERLYKAVTTGKPIVGAAEIQFANQAVGLKPYAPAHLKAQPQGGGDYSVSWIRRTRIGGEWRNNVNAALGEASELYRVRVLDGSTEISSTETSNSSITVAASPGNTIAVAQISETVGPGYEAEITV